MDSTRARASQRKLDALGGPHDLLDDGIHRHRQPSYLEGCGDSGIPWQHALGIAFWAGVVFLLLSVWRIREAIAKAIPQHLRIGAAMGIGLFLLFLGLKGAKFITASPATFITRAPLSEESILAAIGLVVIVVLLLDHCGE